MHKFLLTLLCVLMVVSNNCFAKKPHSLSHGKNLKDWYAFTPQKGQSKATDLFEFSEGIIRLYGAEAGYLMTKKSFTNFELTADFRWNTDENFPRKNNKKNSGLMYLIPEASPDTLWPQGIQFQIKEGASGDFILLQNVTIEQNGEQTLPGRSQVVKSTGNMELEPGEWNHIRIRVLNGQVEQYLNGKLVNEGQNPSVTSGRILLQYEGFPIDFKQLNIQIL